MKVLRIISAAICILTLPLLGGDKTQLLESAARRGTKISQIGDNLFTFEYPNGRSITKNLGEYNNATRSSSTFAIDSTIIDLRTIDTSLYSDKYGLWQEIDVSEGDMQSLLLGDVNQNNRSEIYGFSKSFDVYDQSPVRIFELDTMDVFRQVYQYPDSVYFAQLLYDVDKDGRNEAVMFGIHGLGNIFRTNAPDQLPTSYSLGFNRSGHQYYDPTLADLDKNGKTDLIYGDGLNVYIDEYNSSIPSFDSVYRFSGFQHYVAGYSVGDFDLNGKTDIVYGSDIGDVYVDEVEGMGLYQEVWRGKVETHNAYLHFATKDIDGNGKPEFWVGGDAYYNGLGMTRFTCFETNGNNSYVPVARIDLIGVFSFFAGNCFAKDIDHDGKEEIFICIDGNVIILKFAGGKNHHAYDVFYLKQNDLANQNSVFLGATLYDVHGNSREELFLCMDLVNNVGRREFTRRYKPNFAVSVEKPLHSAPAEFRLFQNYPNPFNNSTKIQFEIPSAVCRNRTTLRVFNTLGEEVRLLCEGIFAAGDHATEWDGKDSGGREVASGIYFLVLENNSYRQVTKSVLLK